MIRFAAVCGALAILAMPGAAPANADTQGVSATDGVTTARFAAPTTRYGHNVLGGLPEYGRLCLARGGVERCHRLPQQAVFEDIAPRLADMDGDDLAEAVVIESTTTGGAALAVYDLHAPASAPDDPILTRTATPPIGRRNRWLAPVGIADFNGDGAMDVAYVEKPHLARRLKIWTWVDGRGQTGDHLQKIGDLPGFSNHRIGDRYILSGLRRCGGLPEMILPDDRWARVVAVRFHDGGWQHRDLGPLRDTADIGEYLSC